MQDINYIFRNKMLKPIFHGKNKPLDLFEQKNDTPTFIHQTQRPSIHKRILLDFLQFLSCWISISIVCHRWKKHAP